MAVGSVQAVDFKPSGVERFFQFSLLGMLASGYLAVAGSNALDLPTAVLGGAALIVRILIVAGLLRFEIPKSWVDIATIGYFLFWPLDYFFLSGTFVDSVVHLVFFVAIVKLLTAETRRDFFLLQMIAFLELLAASVLSSSANFFLFLTLFLFFSIGMFASAEIRRASRDKRVVTRGAGAVSLRLGWLSALTGIGILLITASLFFVLPRTARAALEKLTGETARVSGYSNEVTLGQLGDIRRRGGAVMHVAFGDDKVPQGLKWRGNALGEFDGWKWYNTHQQPELLRPKDGLLTLASDEQLRRQGSRIYYQVILHGNPADALFVAGMAEHLRVSSERVMETPTGALKVPFAEADNSRYFVYSYIGGPAVPQDAGRGRLRESDRIHYLRLPPVDPRVIRLARDLAQGYGSDMARARAIENHLRTQYKYSLSPLDHQPDDPLAYFLFERRAGHCEYFASAMAVMLRTLWIPARVATGFQSGAYNPLTGFQVVRASDAHAWVEAFIPGEGWVAFDPTPADPTSAVPGMWSRISLYLDAADIFWQKWVLGYDLDRQLTLAFEVDQSRRHFSVATLEHWFSNAGQMLGRAGEDAKRSFGSLAAGAVILLSLVFGGRTAWRWLLERRGLLRVRRGDVSRSDAALLYLRMQKLLRRRGFVRKPEQTPLEFARSLPHAPVARAVEEFTVAYHDLRYGGQPSSAARMTALLDTIEQLPRTAR